MSTITIPLRTDLELYEQQVELEGATYGMRLYWNDRDAAWLLDISDAEGAVLKAGIKVVLGLPLAIRGSREGMPPGLLSVVDTGPDNADAGVDELGGRVQLVYLERGA